VLYVDTSGVLAFVFGWSREMADDISHLTADSEDVASQGPFRSGSDREY
jgi:hypothetical protein